MQTVGHTAHYQLSRLNPAFLCTLKLLLRVESRATESYLARSYPFGRARDFYASTENGKEKKMKPTS